MENNIKENNLKSGYREVKYNRKVLQIWKEHFQQLLNTDGNEESKYELATSQTDDSTLSSQSNYGGDDSERAKTAAAGVVPATREISKAAANKFSNHLWYLVPETVALSLFDHYFPTAVKANMTQVILEVDEGEEKKEEENLLKRTAYGSINRQELYKIMIHQGIHPKIIRLVKMTMAETMAQVKIYGG
ncbi:hypothetical protein ANN_03978 [Periplaneta americana]|uniref:Uncharacterized protein n=1 Tax=Periplaneta americana TaxID=6978 RepID=A0ABQ8T7B1_PERAM|nr:hypothetical protein ANN_03978 [Periplaneta americana]